MPCDARASDETAAIAIGTVWRFSSLRCAVTMISLPTFRAAALSDSASWAKAGTVESAINEADA